VLGLGLVLAVLTAGCLGGCRAWDPAALGTGSREFTRLLRGYLGAAVVIGLGILAVGLDCGRPWVFAVLPAAAALSTAGRAAAAPRAAPQPPGRAGDGQGAGRRDVESVTGLIRRTRRVPQHGWLVDGVCTPTGAGPNGTSYVEDVHVVGDLDSVFALVHGGQFDVVSVGQVPGWSARRLQQLACSLDGTGTELAVDPGLMEVAGPRLHMTAVDGLPLLRLSHPTFDGLPRLLKGAVDRIAAVLLLAVLSLPMLVIATAVRLDGGPAFFRQRRVGVGGREFRMVKFRSMVVDAEARKAALVSENEGAGPLFKMRRDPRVTRIGAVLRRYSLDELPQLLNVLAGSMSLVGPRPPLPAEVAGYANAARRRLLVKPGMTGLWQVSGRSELSWEETVRLDLRYVENWTLALDAQILARTVRAMVRGDGAY
jgi:exopolysaccharide biosynthesis polyprenyl glycosylphosphotransferase